MGVVSASTSISILIFVILASSRRHAANPNSSECPVGYPEHGTPPIVEGDIDLMQFAENLEHLEADYFLFGALGYGLDRVAPELASGGPPPIGACKANLDSLTTDIILQFGLQEVGHLRFVPTTYNYFNSFP